MFRPRRLITVRSDHLHLCAKSRKHLTISFSRERSAYRLNCVHKDDRVRTGSGNPFAVLLPYVKVTPGSQRMRELGREEVWEVLGFEEELEWRYVPAGLPIRDSGGHDRVTNADQKLAARYKLLIPDVYLEFIVVTSREEAQQVVAELPRFREKIHIRQRDGSLRPAF